MTTTSKKRPLTTSKAVAAKAARLTHDADPDVRSVAASALAQAGEVEASEREPAPALPSIPVVQTADELVSVPVSLPTPSPAPTFDPDDFRATVLAQCVKGAGAVGFNLESVDDALAAMRVVGELGGDFIVVARGSRVEVTRVR